MFAQSVLPLIRERWGGPGPADILWGTALMVPESNLEEALRKCARQGVTWGTRVDEDRIAFSLRGGSAEDRDAILRDLMELLHPVRVRKGEMKPAELLTDALLVKQATLVTAESCTGGLIGKYMTDLPGSSRVFWGGHVSYSNAAKIGSSAWQRGSCGSTGRYQRKLRAQWPGARLQIRMRTRQSP